MVLFGGNLKKDCSNLTVLIFALAFCLFLFFCLCWLADFTESDMQLKGFRGYSKGHSK